VSFALALASIVAVACSSSTSGNGSDSDGGNSGADASILADAFIAAVVGGGPACPFASPLTNWLDVGAETGDKPTTVANQGSTGSGTAQVQCTVRPTGGAGAVTTSGGSGISATFTSTADSATYTSSNCTIAYT
jgi:hypothetical protein